MGETDEFYSEIKRGLVKSEDNLFTEHPETFFGDLSIVLDRTVCCGLELKNKLCYFNLTDNFLSDGFGNPKREFFDFYHEVAKSGVGTIFTADFVLGKNVKVNQSNANAKRVGVCTLQNNRHNLNFFRNLTGAVHSLGSKIFIGLKSAFGRGDYNNQFLGMFNVSVSGHRNVFSPAYPCAQISDGRVKKIVGEFFDAASAAKNMNFDGVLIDGSSFNILGEFSSKIFNRRHFGYFFNEVDLAEKIVKSVAKIDDIKIFYKLTAATFLRQCYCRQAGSVDSLKRALIVDETLDELVDFIKRLGKAGVCGFVLDFGTFETQFLDEFTEFFEENVFLNFFKELKHRLDTLEVKNKYGDELAFVLCDNHNSLHSLRASLDAGCSLVPLSKQLLADNDYIFKLRTAYEKCLQKRTSESEALSAFEGSVRRCIKCSFCNFCADNFGSTTCSINPMTFQKGLPFASTYTFCENKKVAVVGAGVSGLVASIVLAERGFEVHLFEKNSTLNSYGRAYEIFGFDSLLKNFNDRLETKIGELDRAGKVKVHLKEEFDLSKLLDARGETNFGAAIIATGFHERYFDAVGAVLASSKTIFEVAANKNCLLGRNKFVIYAVSELSFKLALYLAKTNRELTLIISGREIFKEMSNGKLTYYANAFDALGVQVFIGAKIKRIEEDFVEIIYSDNEKIPSSVRIVNYGVGGSLPKNERAKSIIMDMFIYEPELYSNNKLFYNLVKSGYGGQAYLIGNALKIGGMSDCIKSAYFAAKNL